LADVRLPCFVGGHEIALARLGRPAVINLWASWCGPCREELPAFQSFAERAGDSVLVLGVIDRSRRSAAQSIVDDLGLTFPMLDDRDERLKQAVGRQFIPVTLFVDSRGAVVHIYNARALDLASIERLAEQHLGVPVPAR
jgi:thiol-disulfide isomerase/thioredoxin